MSVLHRSIELLEPYDGKLSCTVLRGGSARKGADLPDLLCVVTLSIKTGIYIRFNCLMYLAIHRSHSYTF